jgi:hypothetical protein
MAQPGKVAPPFLDVAEAKQRPIYLERLSEKQAPRAPPR